MTLTAPRAAFPRLHARRPGISVADLTRRILDDFRAGPG